MPVSFHVEVNEDFGQQKTLEKTFPVTSGFFHLAFDVPNPGLDFSLVLSSTEYPLIKDNAGHFWKSKADLQIAFNKEDSIFTNPTNDVQVFTYQSKSESEEMLLGSMTDDEECSSKYACCTQNSTHYAKYKLVDSPVPPYVCAGPAISYGGMVFNFQTLSSFTTIKGEDTEMCVLEATSQFGYDLNSCKGDSLSTSVSRIDFSFANPSTGYALCRPGQSLTDTTFSDSPFPVVGTSFCETRTCIGYTEENYRKDKAKCEKRALGFFTSLDTNNTNQFSSFEKGSASQWSLIFPNCKWTNSITMSSPTTLKEIKLQCDVPPSNNWSTTSTGIDSVMSALRAHVPHRQSIQLYGKNGQGRFSHSVHCQCAIHFTLCRRWSGVDGHHLPRCKLCHRCPRCIR
ncbi:hypothetical protein ADEAN_000847100 [Angomonas deanei]|uniref:Uncharacterized protein n=1 Tax=Angomonas deanei TaxID=59799 RepID=A0A7G2CPB2_9TRYP|nr:hypothetical protein ADEAN_000847100 [Angomonas deanei]